MLTRRSFVTSAVTVLAAAATGCRTAPAPGAAQPRAGDAPLPPAAAPAEPLRIALVSDPHCQWSTTMSGSAANPRLMKAVKDLRQFKPDYWIVNGDIADGGLAGQLAAFKEVMATVTKPERLIVTTGNHDFYDKEATDAEEVERFVGAFGMQTPYSSHLIGSVHVVMLATEQWKTAPRNPDWAWITPAQLRWFEQVLSEQKDKFTAVFLHQPIQDTVAWTDGRAGTGQIAELQGIIAKHPQIRLWLSGHTHQLEQLPTQAATREKTTYVGLGSTYYNFVPAPGQPDPATRPGSGKRDFDVLQSRFMEIYPDRVVIRARDHGEAKWLPIPDVTVTRV